MSLLHDYSGCSLGGPSYLERASFEIIPIGEPEVLSASTFYADLFKEMPKLRLQKEMLNLANIVAHEKFVNYVAHSDTSEKIVLESVKRPNISLLTRLFTANLMQTEARVTKPEFTSTARQFVCLPPLSNGSGHVTTHKCGCGTTLHEPQVSSYHGHTGRCWQSWLNL